MRTHEAAPLPEAMLQPTDANDHGATARRPGDDGVTIASIPNSESSIADGERAAPGTRGATNNRMEIFRNLTRYKSLDRVLERPHITGIAISGTVGIGLFIRTGEVIGLGGGLGATISYLVAGFMIACVMLCLSEMVSFRHEAGAIFEYPKLYVSPALGFAVGIIYWLAYTTSLVTLIAVAAELLDLSTGGTAGVMLGIIILITFVNMIGGVRIYGMIEWVFKWYKILVIVSLWVIMVYINCTESIGTRYWHSNYLVPPGFIGNLYENTTVLNSNISYAELLSGTSSFGPLSVEIEGNGGVILGIFTGINVAIFSFIGVEILIVAAGEARHPREDLPKATSQMYILTIILYLVSTLVVSFNVGFDDPMLESYAGLSGSVSAAHSPFIIAMKRSRLSPAFAEVFKGLFFISAVTTANTNVYVASRTLFALTSNSNFHWVEQHIGHTSHGRTPLWAIGVSLLPSLLALTSIAYDAGILVINVFSEIGTISFLCVYVAECWTFIKFMNGLGARRDQESYMIPYIRIPRQPFYAWCGLISCLFFVALNGWHNFYAAAHGSPARDVFAEMFASYFGPLLFIMLFVGYKIVNRMPEEREENIWKHRSRQREPEQPAMIPMQVPPVSASSHSGGTATGPTIAAASSGRLRVLLREIWLRT